MKFCLPPQGTLAMSGDISACHAPGIGATGFWWVDTNSTTKIPTRHRTAPPPPPPTKRESFSPNVNSDKTEES